MTDIDPQEVHLPVSIQKIETGWLVTDSSKPPRAWAFENPWWIHYHLLTPVQEWLEEREELRAAEESNND